MKSLMWIPMAVVAALITTGCASGGGNNNPVAEWQKERAFAAELSEARDKALPLTLETVLYKSSLKTDALAAPINAFAPIPAALYLKVVAGVDKMAAMQDGRLVYIGIQNDIARACRHIRASHICTQARWMKVVKEVRRLA